MKKNKRWLETITSRESLETGVCFLFLGSLCVLVLLSIIQGLGGRVNDQTEPPGPAHQVIEVIHEPIRSGTLTVYRVWQDGEIVEHSVLTDEGRENIGAILGTHE